MISDTPWKAQPTHDVDDDSVRYVLRTHGTFRRVYQHLRGCIQYTLTEKCALRNDVIAGREEILRPNRAIVCPQNDSDSRRQSAPRITKTTR